MNTKQNPKLEGTNLIDCIPQNDYCPNKCRECFYNNGFFLDIKSELPKLPTLEEVGNKIVRVNTGNDSNNNKQLVIEKTKHYTKKFYNTIIPEFNFPGPVVLTVNGGMNDNWQMTRTLYEIAQPNNVMFVRFRVNTWNLKSLDECVEFFANIHKIPVVLTFMRYKLYENVIEIENYELQKSVVNTYWCIKEEPFYQIVNRHKNNKLIEVCTGKDYANHFCKKCLLCEKYYNKCVSKINK